MSTFVSQKRVWTCAVCQRKDNWGKGWQWYGSLKDEDEFSIDLIMRNIVCSDDCAALHKPDILTKGRSLAIAVAERREKREKREAKKNPPTIVAEPRSGWCGPR